MQKAFEFKLKMYMCEVMNKKNTSFKGAFLFIIQHLL